MTNKSWRTTTCGILAIVICLATVASHVIQGQSFDLNATFTCLSTAVAGLGLLHAADHKNISQ